MSRPSKQPSIASAVIFQNSSSWFTTNEHQTTYRMAQRKDPALELKSSLGWVEGEVSAAQLVCRNDKKKIQLSSLCDETLA